MCETLPVSLNWTNPRQPQTRWQTISATLLPVWKCWCRIVGVPRVQCTLWDISLLCAIAHDLLGGNCCDNSSEDQETRVKKTKYAKGQRRPRSSGSLCWQTLRPCLHQPLWDLAALGRFDSFVRQFVGMWLYEQKHFTLDWRVRICTNLLWNIRSCLWGLLSGFSWMGWRKCMQTGGRLGVTRFGMVPYVPWVQVFVTVVPTWVARACGLPGECVCRLSPTHLVVNFFEMETTQGILSEWATLAKVHDKVVFAPQRVAHDLNGSGPCFSYHHFWPDNLHSSSGYV